MNKSSVQRLLAGVFALVSSAALANFHTFVIDEIYSNASGTVQYVVLQESSVKNDEHLFATQRITRTIAGAQFKAFVFPNDLPSKATASKYVLIATQSFAALGVITPDYIVPDGFVPISNGLIDFATVDEVSYTALPTDGNALYRDGTRRQNVAKNFAGQTASVGPAVALPNYQGLWFNPNESGWGVNFAHQGDLIFASWFTYDLSGKGTWLVTTAEQDDRRVVQPANCSRAPARPSTRCRSRRWAVPAARDRRPGRHRHRDLHRPQQRAVHLHRRRHHPDQEHHPAAIRAAAGVHVRRAAEPGAGDQLHRPVVGQSARLGSRLGNQSHPPGRYAVRQLVHLRSRPYADVAGGDGEQDRADKYYADRSCSS